MLLGLTYREANTRDRCPLNTHMIRSLRPDILRIPVAHIGELRQRLQEARDLHIPIVFAPEREWSVWTTQNARHDVETHGHHFEEPRSNIVFGPKGARAALVHVGQIPSRRASLIIRKTIDAGAPSLVWVTGVGFRVGDQLHGFDRVRAAWLAWRAGEGLQFPKKIEPWLRDVMLLAAWRKWKALGAAALFVEAYVNNASRLEGWSIVRDGHVSSAWKRLRAVRDFEGRAETGRPWKSELLGRQPPVERSKS